MHKLKTDFSHYDIYQFKGWTLREVQNVQQGNIFNDLSHKWERVDLPVKTTIVWGVHQECGLRGLVMLSVGKAWCNHCEAVMPSEVFENLENAMNFMKDGLEKE